jgi:outer membrane lipoprotein-sorting protein
MNLLIALALLVQDRSAEAAFKKIEQKIEAAQSISLRFTMESTGIEGKRTGASEVSGPLMIKNPRKLRLEYTGTLFDGTRNRDRSARFVTDGENVLAEIAGEKLPLATTIKSGFKPLISKCGVKIGWGVLLIHKSDPTGKSHPVDLDLAGRFTLVDFKRGEDDGPSKTLAYTLRRNVGAEQVDVAMKIWYDPKTFLLTKRVLEEPNRVRTTETYSDLKLNPAIGDDTFEVSDAK